jgi:hypothetical protein
MDNLKYLAASVMMDVVMNLLVWAVAQQVSAVAWTAQVFLERSYLAVGLWPCRDQCAAGHRQPDKEVLAVRDGD